MWEYERPAISDRKRVIGQPVDESMWAELGAGVSGQRLAEWLMLLTLAQTSQSFMIARSAEGPVKGFSEVIGRISTCPGQLTHLSNYDFFQGPLRHMMCAIVTPPILDLSFRPNRLNLYPFLWLAKCDDEKNLVVNRYLQRLL